jgi:hypothetical protein
MQMPEANEEECAESLPAKRPRIGPRAETQCAV